MVACPPPKHQRCFTANATSAGFLGDVETCALIGRRLQLKTDNVRHHARAIERNLGVKTRLAAAKRLIQWGISAKQKVAVTERDTIPGGVLPRLTQTHRLRSPCGLILADFPCRHCTKLTS